MTTIIDFSQSKKIEAQENLSIFILNNKTNFIFQDCNWDDNI